MAKLLDPVCGMTVDDTALRAEGHDDVAFCAPGCRTSFLANPDAYPDRLEASEPAGHECGCGNKHGGDHKCAHGDSHGHGAHEPVATTEPVAAGSGCCGGHGH